MYSNSSNNSNPTELEEQEETGVSQNWEAPEEEQESYPDKVTRIMDEYSLSEEESKLIVGKLIQDEMQELDRQQQELQQEIDSDNNNNNDKNTYNASLNLKDRVDIELVLKDQVIGMSPGMIVCSKLDDLKTTD